MLLLESMGTAALVVATVTAREWGAWFLAHVSAVAVGCVGVRAFCCTFGGFLPANRCQRGASAAEGGLVYCLEPVFASAFALFLPAWFSGWAAIAYANEKLTASLLLGGGLITAANVLAQLPSTMPKPSAADITIPALHQRDG